MRLLRKPLFLLKIHELYKKYSVQDIEPYYNWRHLYMAEEDPRSPFYGNEYSEFEYSQTVYNYYLHPQWDEFGSRTLFMKILFAEYDQQFAIIELIGEWNDAIENDIMTLRRNITDLLYEEGIRKFVLIGENVLNFHSSDDSYYEDWKDQLDGEGGWVAILNLPDQSKHDFTRARITNYVWLTEMESWRTYLPETVCQIIDTEINRQLN